jgi:hypothetical protein
VLWRILRRKFPETPAAAALLDQSWIDKGIALGALGGLAGFFASGIVHYNWGDSEVVMVMYLIMGLCLFVDRANELSSPANQA